MKTSQLMAGASRSAHFAGLSRASRRAAEADDREDTDAQDDQDEPKGKRSRAADDDDQPKSKGKSSRRADGDDDGKDASDGDDDQEEPKSKRSRASDDDDDDEEPKSKGKTSRRAADDDGDEDADDDEDDDKQEMSGRSSAANARRRERARCAAIFGHEAAADNVALAASLAFETTMTRQEAIAVLRGQASRPAAPRGRRSTREDRNVDLSGSDEPGGRKPKAGSSWDRSFKSVGVLPRI